MKIYHVLVCVATLSACKSSTVDTLGGATTDGNTVQAANIAINDLCAGSDYVETCAGFAPSVTVTVLDGNSKPVPNAAVMVYGPTGIPITSMTAVDPNLTASDSLGRLEVYNRCTNANGMATFCGFATNANKLAAIGADKSGYMSIYTPQPYLSPNEVRNVTLTMPANPNATEEKILLMECVNTFRTADELAGQNVKYTMAPIDQAMETLLATNPNGPYGFFDTFIVGALCNQYTMFGEFLNTTNPNLLFNWVNGGGLLVLSQPKNVYWDPNTGCTYGTNGTANGYNMCPVDLLPAAYKFSLLPAPTTGCDAYVEATVTDSNNPLMANVNFHNWNYIAKHQWDYRNPNNNKSADIDYCSIAQGSVNQSVWTPFAYSVDEPAGTGMKSSVCTPPGLFGNASNPNAPASFIGLEANYGAGKILVLQYAWQLGSSGASIPPVDPNGNTTAQCPFDPNAVTAATNVINYIKAWQK